MSINLKEAAEFLKANDFFTILCHANPDGDTLGSAFALCGALQLMGKSSRVLCADKPSDRFDFLKSAITEQAFPDTAEETVITTDVADCELLGDFKDKYKSKVALCIDHHVSNRAYAEKTLLDETAAACAEIVWEIIKQLPITPTKGIAAAVYTGISTDTGCFRYSNTTAKSHIITAELMEYDFDISSINYLMFDMKTKERVELELNAYSSIEYHFGGKCAVITLTKDMLDKVDTEDANNVSGIPRQIEGVEAGIVLKERDKDLWKASIRTSPKVDAQQISGALGGGGHKRAAGCTIKGTYDFVKSELLRELGKQI
ncbi:MAG: bifunctional oligoribonuclease/PAP phosphatase NrnA [Oscillospiraceae bacterium]|nr:bifunctional oligoribonuclease/PAP phosphatase NrnA [Oscillospiraceae bacterium]